MSQTAKLPHIEPISIPVEGMTCASCVRRVETAAAKVPGVATSSVNFATKKLTVEPTEDFSPEALTAAIEKVGYEVPAGAMQRALKDAGYVVPVDNEPGASPRSTGDARGTSPLPASGERARRPKMRRTATPGIITTTRLTTMPTCTATES